MESILLYIENFLSELPPLLQLLAGVFVTLGIMKIIIFAADLYEKNKSENQP